MKKIGYALGITALVAVGVVFGAMLTNQINNDSTVVAGGMFSSFKEEEKFQVELGPVLSNLKHSETDKHEYIKIQLSIEVSGEENKELLEEQQPLVRDTVNRLLRHTKKEDIYDTEDRDLILKRDLKEKLNIELFEGDEAVTNIYILELLLQ